MSFGFSVGDFLGAATLIKDIVICLKDSGGSSSEYQELMDELDGLRTVLDKIDHLEGNESQKQSINSIKVAALNCKFVLQSFLPKLQKYDKSLDRGKTAGKTKDAVRKIKWEMSMKDDVQNLRSYLQMHTSSLNMRLSAEGLSTLHTATKLWEQNQQLLAKGLETTQAALRVVNQHGTYVEQIRQDEQKAEILEWLSPLDMHDKQHDTYSQHQPNTGDWFLMENKFLAWLLEDDSHPLLWCPGNPGSGKSVMASAVINFVQTKFQDQNVGIAFTYCDYKEGRGALELIGALARQLVEQTETLPSKLLDSYVQSGHGRKRPDLKLLEDILELLSRGFDKTLIFIDALDECTVTSERGMFLSAIEALQKASIKAFVTSRPNLEDIKAQLACGPQVEIVAHELDIRKYLEAKISSNAAFKKRICTKSGLETTIINTIAKRASGMFLMAVLQLDRIFVERTASRIMKALEMLPPDLHTTYKDTLERIKNQAEPDNFLGIRVLMWISKTLRPLQVSELCHALSVEWDPDDDPPRNFDSENLLDPESLVEVCAGLVIIEPESQIVKLVHFTAEEFFRSTPGLFEDASIEMTRTCLVYLSFDDFACGMCSSLKSLQERLQQYPFARYAGKHWGDHLRGDNEVELEDMAFHMLKHPGLFHSSVQFFNLIGLTTQWSDSNRFATSNMTALQFVASFGLVGLAKKLLDQGEDVNEKGVAERPYTALMQAAIYGHAAMASLLIERGAVLDQLSVVGGQTALMKAAQHGHENVVRLLLDWGANGGVCQDTDRTVLSDAIWWGQAGVVRLLLQKGISTETRFHGGQTPLLQAAMRCREEVVKVLIEEGALVDAESKQHETALMHAAMQGHVGIAKLLLKKGAGINAKRRPQFFTPLMYAAMFNQLDLVKLLVEGGAEMNAKDRNDMSALSHATKKKHHEIVSFLLGRGASEDAIPTTTA